MKQLLVTAAGAKETDTKSTKVCPHPYIIHSAIAAKSIPSPTRCRTSLSQALGLVP